MIPQDYLKYKLELFGGPKDGHTEFVKFLDVTLEYPTECGRIAVYRKSDAEGVYRFQGYKGYILE